MRGAWRYLLAGCGACALLGCDANVVDAVHEPPPVMEPEPVLQSPLETSLIHRYSFDGDGTAVLDSKGAAHGEVIGTVLGGDGTLPLAGARSAEYVNLPNGLISGLSSATIEAWLTWQGGDAWQRIFDFGSSSAGEDAQGTGGVSYLFLTTAGAGDPTRMLPAVLRLAFSTNGIGEEDTCQGNEPFPIGVLSHVAVVVDPATESLALYQNGALVNQCTFARPLSLIDDVNDWLGHSNYVADVDLEATYDEFRIYGAALTAAELNESFLAGPDASK